MSSELLWKSIFTQYSNQNPLQNSLTESSQYRIYIILGYKMIYLFSQLFLVPIYLTYIWGYLQTFYFFYTLWVSLPFFCQSYFKSKEFGGMDREYTEVLCLSCIWLIFSQSMALYKVSRALSAVIPEYRIRSNLWLLVLPGTKPRERERVGKQSENKRISQLIIENLEGRPISRAKVH